MLDVEHPFVLNCVIVADVHSPLIDPFGHVPLVRVTFCVLDLETTGTDPNWDEITEVGAIIVCGGERLGTFHTLVGGGWPDIDAVLPSLLEFIGDSVITGHNIQFDLRFLNAALARSGRAALGTDHVVDTMPLARRLARDDADDCRLGTLAERFSLEHRPSHRAFEDAAATVDLLHLLIERSSSYGVVNLDDLRRLPPLAGHRHAAKLRLTADLPREPGVLICHGAGDDVVLVCATTDVRSAARQLFDGTDARRLAPVLRELRRCRSIPIESSLARAVAVVRLVQQHGPAWQRRELASQRAHFVLVSPAGGTAVGRTPRPGWRSLGPMPDRATARAAATARAEHTVEHTADQTAFGVTDGDAAATDDPVLRALARRRAEALADLDRHHRRLDRVRGWTGRLVDDGIELTVVDGVLDHPSIPARSGLAGELDLHDERLLVADALERAGSVAAEHHTP